MPRDNSDGTFAFVYILASSYKRLYIGLTTTLMARVAQHKRKAHPDSFTARYSIDRLVYFERFSDIHRAIAREKELRGGCAFGNRSDRCVESDVARPER